MTEATKDFLKKIRYANDYGFFWSLSSMLRGRWLWFWHRKELIRPGDYFEDADLKVSRCVAVEGTLWWWDHVIVGEGSDGSIFHWSAWHDCDKLSEEEAERRMEAEK